MGSCNDCELAAYEQHLFSEENIEHETAADVHDF